jgi:Uma2 family endonuclease
MATSVDPEIAALLPEQGAWSERDYLWLTDHITRPVEYVDGHIEVLPTPTDHHQAILQYLLYAWHALLVQIGGVVRCAPLRLRLANGHYREPDLLILRSAQDRRRANAWWEGADLVVEIVSPDDPDRDYITKRREYEQTGIGEYWIVDAERETITILRLQEQRYMEHAVVGRGAVATSVSFPDYAVAVDAVLDAP